MGVAFASLGIAREPGWGVGLCNLVALRIGRALAVVGGADHDGAVDIAFGKGHDHFRRRAE